MSIDQKVKHRFCGYCGRDIYADFFDFSNHINVCELILSNKQSEKRKDENKTDQGNPQVGEI